VVGADGIASGLRRLVAGEVSVLDARAGRCATTS
jgi:2-polyprenyl-6-methoxyphenol hydroxylase-like FAD-dependent oxidoreductase